MGFSSQVSPHFEPGRDSHGGRMLALATVSRSRTARRDGGRKWRCRMLRLKRTLRGGLSGPIFVLAVVALSGGASRAADVIVAAPALRHPPIHIHHVR